jgi:hypothetical protein
MFADLGSDGCFPHNMLPVGSENVVDKLNCHYKSSEFMPDSEQQN